MCCSHIDAAPRFRRPAHLAFLVLALALPARAEVDLAAPFEGPAQSGTLAPLDVDGVLIEPPVPTTGAKRVHGGRFSLFSDTSAAPSIGGSCPDLMPKPFATEAAPSLPLHWNEALGEANATVGQLDGGTIQDFFDVFEQAVEVLGGDVQSNIGPTTQQCVGWTPIQGRFLRSQWNTSGPQVPWKSSTLYSYHAHPTAFREMRERGARLYCAARTAQFAQGPDAHSMGERVGFSVNVLGETLDFLVVEPTLALDGPERFTGGGAADGSQAFEVPLLLGTRITPIRGLPLPGFREVRVPVSLVTADTEVRNASDLGPVFMGSSIQCNWQSKPPYLICKLIPAYETKYRKDSLTITHLDVLRTAKKLSTITGETEVFRIGPVAVELGFGIGYFLGVPLPSNDRVLSYPGLPAARTGHLWWNPASGARWHDGAWTLRYFEGIFGTPFDSLFWTVLPDGDTDSFWREPLDLWTPPPLDLRLVANDDHLLGSSTGLEISGELSGLLGGSFGPFTVKLSVTGSLTGTVAQHHVLSDALLAQDQGFAAMTPVTGLTVRPRQTGKADLLPAKGTLRLGLSLPWPLDDIEIVKNLFEIKKVTLADYDSDDGLTPADEQWNFRLGTGSARGSVTTKPHAFLHFPGGSEIASFPVDVETCLADEEPNPPPPAPCDPTPAQGAVPTAEVCVYGPGPGLRSIAPMLPPLPAKVCSNIPGWVATLTMLSLEQRECLFGYLQYLCRTTSKQQPLGTGKQVVAHVLDLLDPSDGEALAGAITTCVEAFGVAGEDGAIDSSSIADGFIEAGVCKKDGTILEDDEILGAAGNPKQPPLPQSAAACH